MSQPSPALAERTRHASRMNVVVPCFNEEQVLPETARRLSSLLDTLIAEQRLAASSRVLFVDDGSSDNTWQIIENLGRNNARIGGIKLSRNRGHQNALLAGLFSATGDVV